MFDVLVFVYENYWRGDDCPESDQLARKLSAVGFETEEIREALSWLDGLSVMAQGTHWLPPEVEAKQHARELVRLQAPTSMRVYTVAEQDHLGASCLGFVSFLESANVLPPPMREIVLDRAMAVPAPITLDDLKLIVLMVYWRFGEEPDALVLDELCDDTLYRVAH